ncbi:MAG: DUF481 domain-containing protein [Candidatus Aminicenantaceae bacterium]
MSGPKRIGLLALLLLGFGGLPALCVVRTDIIYLQNGDRITGEIRKLERGRLEYKTDDMKILEVEWLKIDFIQSIHEFDVESVSGRRYQGTLDQGEEKGQMIVTTENARVTLYLRDIVRIDRLRSTFWKRIRGYLDAGLGYEKATDQWTWALGGEANYRTQKWATGFVVSSYFRNQQKVQDTRRNNVNYSLERIFQNRWLGLGFGQLEQNDELNLALRELLGVAVGRYIIQNNTMLFSWLAGATYTREKATGETEFTSGAELLLGGRFEAFRFVHPELDFSISLSAFPSLTEKGRVRINLDTRLRYEILRDFFFTVSLFDKFDGVLRTDGVRSNDFGFDTKISWSFR